VSIKIKIPSEKQPEFICFQNYSNKSDKNITLTVSDAENLIEALNYAISQEGSPAKTYRKLIYTLDVLEGYKKFNCDSVEECLQDYFPDKKSISSIYREANAAKVEANIAPNARIGEIPELTLRYLGWLKDPKEQRKAWRKGMKEKEQDELYPMSLAIRAIVKKAVSEGAELSDPRAAKTLASSPEERFQKSIRRLRNKLKARLACLDDAEGIRRIESTIQALNTVIREIEPESEPAAKTFRPKEKNGQPGRTVRVVPVVVKRVDPQPKARIVKGSAHQRSISKAGPARRVKLVKVIRTSTPRKST